MRVLVTGASGFVGRHTVAELTARGHEVIAAVRAPERVPDELRSGAVELARVDLRRPPPELGDLARRAEAIVHLATSMAGTPRSRFDATVLGTENLLAALEPARWSGRFVQVSSLAVYGFNQVPQGGTIDESTPLEPHIERRDDYAWTKTWQERLLRRYAERSPATIAIVRPGSIYGPGRGFQHRLGREVRGGLILIGGRNPMPLQYVENAASLLAACAEHPAAAGEVFNGIDPEPMRQWEYLRAWRAAQSPRPWVIPVPLPLYRAFGAAYDAAQERTGGRIGPPGFFESYVNTPSLGRFRFATGKATAMLGWTPPVGRAEALRRTFGDGH